MSENVAAVRRVLAAFSDRNLDAVLEAFSADCEFDFSNSRGPLSAVYRGRDETREFLSSFLEPWAALATNTEELVEIADDRVLTVNEIRTRGQGSGVEVEATGAMIWTIRAGEVVAAKMFQSKADALEAAAS